MSSENWNLASGKHYEINGTDVLTSNTLGSGIINSSLTSVGTLGSLTVSGNVNANGNIVGDNSTNISGINSVTATSFYGSGANLTSIPNTALTNSSVNYGGVSLDLGASDATPAFDLSDATAYPTSSLVGTITNAQLAGSIANAKLANSSIAIGGVTLNLGDTDATPAFDLSDATNYPFTSLTGITTEILGDTTPQLGGNLDLNSNNVTGTGNFNVTGVITATTFSGNLPTTDLTGTITNAQLAGSIANAKLANSSIAIGGVTLNLGDTDATPAFNLSDATAYPYTSLTGITTSIVGDTTPQLGGNLDLNSKFITGTGGINVTGVVTATTFSGNLPTTDLTGTITNAQLAGSIANSKLANDSISFGGVSLDLGASDATPAFDLSDATSYPTSSLSGTITNAQLAGSIANAKLANSTMSVGGVTLTLGATDATPAFNLSDATAYPYTSLTGITTEIVGDTTPQLGGNLDLNSKFITGTGGINVTGVITATSFSGSGSALTGLTGASAATYGDASNVAQIVVNSDGKITGISNVTISGGGGGSSGISSVGIQSGGTPVGAGATLMNFVGTGITMSATGGLIDIHIPVSTRTTTRTVATNAQTTFSATYTVGYVDVYLNGSKLDSTEFTATNGTSVVLGTGASTGDIIETVAQNITASVDLNGLANLVDDTAPQLGGNLDINGKFIAGTGGINVTGVVTATSFVGSSAVVGSGVTINSSGLNVTGVVTATSFVGNVTGNADTATNTTVADESSDTSCFPLFVTAATGNLPPKSGSNLTFDSSAGILGATTFAGNVDLSGLLKEGVNITAGKLSANLNIDLANGMVHLFTTTEDATALPNIRVDGSTSLNASMSIGEAITVVLITTTAAAGYSAELQIDGSAVTEEWLGGSAPSTGGSGGYDVYTYNIIKTADATFVVLANLVNFA